MPVSTSHHLPSADLLVWLTNLTFPQLYASRLQPLDERAAVKQTYTAYRVYDRDGQSYLALDFSAAPANLQDFEQRSAFLRQSGVKLPHTHGTDVARGFLLIDDFGPVSYLQQLNEDNANPLTLAAIDALITLQIHSQPEALPPYERPALLAELELFTHWYIGQHLGITLNDTQSSALQKVFDALLARIAAQAQVSVHHDLQARHLFSMADGVSDGLSDGMPGMMGYEGACHGPLCYDIVSLLRDASIVWDEERVLDWAIRYWERAKRAGLPVSPDIDSFYQDFEYTGVQRHLYQLGQMAQRHCLAPESSPALLADQAPLLSYLRKTAARYRPLAPLARLFDELENKSPQVGYTF